PAQPRDAHAWLLETVRPGALAPIASGAEFWPRKPRWRSCPILPTDLAGLRSNAISFQNPERTQAALYHPPPIRVSLSFPQKVVSQRDRVPEPPLFENRGRYAWRRSGHGPRRSRLSCCLLWAACALFSSDPRPIAPSGD